MNAPLREYMAQQFAVQTRINLDFIEVNKRRFGANIFEVTQLINSTMGILLFPVEHLLKQTGQEFPDAMLEIQWGEKFTVVEDRSKKYLKDWTPEERFIKLCRNAFAHGNIDLGEAGKPIKNIRLWNFPGLSKNYPEDRDWEISISIRDLKSILIQIANLMEQQLPKLNPDGLGIKALSERPDLLEDDSEQAAD